MTILHQLINPLEYSYKGNMVKGELVTITAPTPRESSLVATIEEVCVKAQIISESTMLSAVQNIDFDKLKQLEKKRETFLEENKEQEKEVCPNTEALEQIKKLMHAEGGYFKCELALKEIFRNSAVIDSETKINGDMFDKISIKDKKLLLGKFIINFTDTSIS